MRRFSYDGSPILYLVATPIGNLEDITYRASRILKEVKRIYAEDTRNSLVLLKHYDIKTPLVSYHDFSSLEEAKKIIDYILAGNDVALISDAGMPVISDPGFKLVELANQNDIRVVVVPGPSAFITAFAASNLAMPLHFYGFLPPKELKRQEVLENIKYQTGTLIFYEAPHRLKETVKSMLTIFGDRKAVIARELTKKYEEYIWDNLSNLNLDLKGEIVLLVEGHVENNEKTDPFKLIDLKVKEGTKLSSAVKEVALMLNLKKNELYLEYLKKKENQ